MLINQIERYELHAHARGFSSSTIVHVKRCLSFFTKFMGGIGDITDITADDLRHFIVALKGKTAWENLAQGTGNSLSPATINTYVRAVKSFWSWLQKERYISGNRLTDLALTRVPENIPKIITSEQFKSLISNVDTSTPDGSKYYCILLILYDNGMRISELIMLKISDIDFVGKTIRVMGKGQRERIVPITVYTRRHIIKYINGARSKLCPDDCLYLFADSDGESISKNSVQQFMKRLLLKSDLKEVKFSPHILRHSFATQFLANGGSVFHLKAILGHKSLATTLRYTKLQVQDVQKQHAKFSPVAQLFQSKL